MDTDQSKHNLSSDRPERTPERDQLEYTPFAKYIAKSIVEMAPADGLVMGIYAPWGAGKTTALNFVEHYIGEYDEGSRPIVIPFNPWWFAGDEHLARHFFDQVISQLASNKKLVSQEVRSAVARFADAVSDLPLTKIISYLGMGAGVPIPVEGVVKGIGTLLKEEQKDVSKLKDEVIEVLGKQTRKLLVVIDDIDRLTPEETRQLFRVVKAVADFPNVVYLLAFDNKKVAQALTISQTMPGDEYLEKIVQVPFVLPLPDKISLRQLLVDRFNQIITSDTVHFDQGYWVDVYSEGIDPFIKTPRDVVRLTNTVSVTYPAVAGEVNPVDFLAIESLRVFQPDMYDIIRRNPEQFAGHTDNDRYNDKQFKSFHSEWLDGLSKEAQPHVKALIQRLFPKTQSVWGNTIYGASSESSWRRNLRICSRDVFLVYFRLCLPPGAISNAEVQASLSLVSDPESFGERLIELSSQIRPDGISRAYAILDRLQDYTEDTIATDLIPGVLLSLFDVADRLVASEIGWPRGLFDLGIDIQIGRVVWQLLRRIDEPERFSILKTIVEHGQSLGMIVREIVVLGQQHGKYSSGAPDSPDRQIVTIEHLTELEILAVERIRAGAAAGELLENAELASILYRWADWGSENEAKNWFTGAIASDQAVLKILEAFLGKSRSQSLGSAAVQTHYRLDPVVYEPFVDIDVFSCRVREVASLETVTDNQRIAIAEYIREKEIRDQGKEPHQILD